jgi:hypothetical protein
MSSTSIYPSTKIVPYVYKLTHKVTKQFYFGVRFSKNQKLPSHIDLGTHYFTSSKCIKQLGFDNFDTEILAEFPFDGGRIDAYLLEQQLIEENFSNSLILNKNISKTNKGSFYFWMHKGSTCQAISDANKGRKLRDYDYKHSLESKNKISEGVGRKCSCILCKVELSSITSLKSHFKSCFEDWESMQCLFPNLNQKKHLIKPKRIKSPKIIKQKRIKKEFNNCLECQSKVNRRSKKFCNSSCAAKYNNKLRPKGHESRIKSNESRINKLKSRCASNL